MNSLLRKVIVWLWKYSASRYMVKLWQFKARLHLHDFYSDMVCIDTIVYMEKVLWLKWNRTILDQAYISEGFNQGHFFRGDEVLCWGRIYILQNWVLWIRQSTSSSSMLISLKQHTVECLFLIINISQHMTVVMKRAFEVNVLHFAAPPTFSLSRSFYHLCHVFDIMHFCNVCTMYQIRLYVAILTWTDFHVKRLQTNCECIYHISISLSIYISWTLYNMS